VPDATAAKVTVPEAMLTLLAEPVIC